MQIWFSMSFFNRPLIAIDIGSSSVKLMELSGKGSARKLVNVALETLPRGAVVDGELVNMSQVTDVVKKMIANLGISTRRRKVALSVAGGNIIVKRVHTLVANEEEIAEQLFEEAKQHFHHDMQDMYFRFAKIPSQFTSQQDESVFVIAAARISVVEQYVQFVHELGMKVAVIDADVLCSANMFQWNYISEDKTTAIINIGATNTQISISYGHEFLFNRDFQYGGDQFTEQIAKSLSVDFENAESMKIAAASGETSAIGDINSILSSPIEEFATEVQKTIGFFESSDELPPEVKEIEQVIFAGGAALTPGLAQAISSYIDAPVRLANPFQNIDIQSQNNDIQDLVVQAPIFSVASGLALRLGGET